MHIIVYMNFVTQYPFEIVIISGFFYHWAQLFQLVLYIQRELLVYSKRFSLQFVFAFTTTYTTIVDKASNNRSVGRIAFFPVFFHSLVFFDQNSGHYRILYNVRFRFHVLRQQQRFLCSLMRCFPQTSQYQIVFYQQTLQVQY